MENSSKITSQKVLTTILLKPDFYGEIWNNCSLPEKIEIVEVRKDELYNTNNFLGQDIMEKGIIIASDGTNYPRRIVDQYYNINDNYKDIWKGSKD